MRYVFLSGEWDQVRGEMRLGGGWSVSRCAGAVNDSPLRSHLCTRTVRQSAVRRQTSFSCKPRREIRLPLVMLTQRQEASRFGVIKPMAIFVSIPVPHPRFISTPQRRQ